MDQYLCDKMQSPLDIWLKVVELSLVETDVQSFEEHRH